MSLSNYTQFAPLNLNGGQKMLVSAPAGTGKTSFLYLVVEDAVSKGKSISVLNVDERESEMDEYRKRGATVWGVPSSYIAKYDDKLDMIRSYVDLIKIDDSSIVIIDSLTGIYDIMDNTVEFNDLMEGRAMKTGGYNPLIKDAIKQILNELFDGGRRALICSITTNEGRNDQVRLFQDIAKDCNAELHLSKKLADLGLFPAVNFRKSYCRNPETFLSQEELSRLKEIKYLLSNLTDGEVVRSLYNLKVTPNIRL